ncbi:MAG: hypothetical protein ACT4QC_19840 [Planctomycetaceae bacterium]
MPKASSQRQIAIPGLKQALAEVLHEQRDFLQEIVADVIEDAGLVRAIREGRKGKPVSRAKVMAILRGRK